MGQITISPAYDDLWSFILKGLKVKKKKKKIKVKYVFLWSRAVDGFKSGYKKSERQAA